MVDVNNTSSLFPTSNNNTDNVLAFFTSWTRAEEAQMLAVSADGGPLTLQQGVIRRLPFYALTIIPFLGWLATLALGIAIIVTAVQDEPTHQGLHDKWAKTRVVDA